MTKEQIKNRMEEIEKVRWYLNMKDRWTARDYELDRKLEDKYNELRERG